ncbi:MAG: hypothetical protein Q8S01_09525 [Ignavibacteria bacterium]|nr:hypothetical protein [Ignavibacteria bacterium]
MVTHAITGGLVHLSGNPIQIILTADAVKANHKLAVKVTCDALMGSPFVEEIAPNRPSLQAVFNISGFIDQPVAHDFDFPAVGVVSAHPKLAFAVTIDIGEVWTDSSGDRQVAWNNLSVNNSLTVIKGKLRPYELGLLNDDGKDFSSQYINGGKFLTHLPNFQVVSPTQIVKLWYLSRWTNIHNAQWNLSITTDLKIGRLPISGEAILNPVSGLLEFSINPAFIGFNIGHGENIVSYTFWLSDSEGDISERRTYIVDNAYYEKAFLFIYVNPLSGVDSIWLTGQYSEGLKTESEIAYRAVPVLSGSKVASQTTISSSSQRTWELNTGPKSHSEILALRDFLSAKQCWMVDPANDQKLIPVNIEPGDHKLFDSREDIQNLDIKIMEAH